MTALASDHPPAIRLPDPGFLFSNRSARFRHLSQAGSPLGGYLGLMAELAQAQHDLSKGLCGTEPLTVSGNIVPLDIASWTPGSVWRASLKAIAERLGRDQAALVETLEPLRQASDELLDTWATSLLTANFDHLDAAFAPFVAAGLQMHWSFAGSRLDVARLPPGHFGSNCPVCGFLPVAGVLQTGGAVQGLRYLVCGLCASQWNRPRIHCIHCGSSKEVAYFGIEDGGEAVKVEACAGCKTYIKLMNREKDGRLDPFADDLATLSLDLLMAEAGYQRFGFNPLLVPGR